MWLGRWYWGRCLTPSPNSTTASASKLSSRTSTKFSSPTSDGFCSLPDTSLRWSPMVIIDKRCMIRPCWYRPLSSFAAWWWVLIFFQQAHVRAHTIQYERNLTIYKKLQTWIVFQDTALFWCIVIYLLHPQKIPQKSSVGNFTYMYLAPSNSAKDIFYIDLCCIQTSLISMFFTDISGLK